jgi:O-antigen biosynthesis protein
MKQLSVIIVNYNVCHFLEQCLLSVEAACKGLDAEVIVIDNNSVDGSVAMVREKFPLVQMIANEENAGFSKANNQGIRISAGKYVLLLNPDTIVEADTFSKCIDFMDEHPDAGGLGVYMVDGKGEFLPESKRSLPTPDVAFYKIFGLSSLFPRSKRFGKYHLGYLDKQQIHEVDVLSGAYMMLRKETLEKTGLLDETFFMYGEDIDLSYRITKAGYRNYYFPGARIIHYKGESTRKSSINYVFIFYQAMIIFSKKHFSGKNARLFSAMIRLAIYFRASIAVARRTFLKLAYPIADIALLWGGLWFIKEYWASYVRFGIGSDYPIEFMTMVVPAYILVWLVSMFFSGAYDKPVNISRTWRGMGAGTVIILVVYALLPESLRFSRALIILGFFWASLALPFYRYLLGMTGIPSFRTDKGKQRRIAIIGTPEEAERVAAIVRKTNPDAGFVGLVNTKLHDSAPEMIGNMNQINEIIAVYNITELIFCLRDIDAKQIIDMMTTGVNGTLEYRIAPPESIFLVGAGSLDTKGELYLFNINTIVSKANRRNKRFLDIVSSLIFLLLFPITLPLQKNLAGFIKNAVGVMLGSKSWVGYSNHENLVKGEHLPSIRNGVLHPADGLRINIEDEQMLQGLNLIYARDYHILTDIKIILKNFRKLGTRTS